MTEIYDGSFCFISIQHPPRPDPHRRTENNLQSVTTEIKQSKWIAQKAACFNVALNDFLQTRYKFMFLSKLIDANVGIV